MNEDQHTIIAFSGLLLSICYLATIAAILAFYGKYAEALGFGGLTTGLVGVLGTFKPRTPSGSTQTGDVNVTTPANPTSE